MPVTDLAFEWGQVSNQGLVWRLAMARQGRNHERMACLLYAINVAMKLQVRDHAIEGRVAHESVVTFYTLV